MNLPCAGPIFLALSLLSMQAQTAAPDPAQMLLYASQQTVIETPETPPFHLQAAFDTFDYLGVSTGSGTLEAWWDGKSRARHDTTYRGATETLIRDGRAYITGDLFHPTIENMLVSALFAPLPARIDSSIPVDLVLEPDQIVGGVYLDCVTLKIRGATPHPMQAAPPSYCFSPKSKLARAVTGGWYFTTTYNSILPFGPKQFAHDIAISQDGHRRAALHIRSVKPWEPEDAAFTLPPGAHGPPPPVPIVKCCDNGQALTRVEPIYPEEARRRRLAGSVYMWVTVSSEGKPLEVEIAGSVDPLLSASAVQSVEQWTFSPHMVDGKPSPMRIEVQVIFGAAK